MLCCDVFMFLVKQGVPSYEDLEWLSRQLENWEELGRRLDIEKGMLTAIGDDYKKKLKKIYEMLQHWKEKNGSAATYKVLHDALCHPLVCHRGLAEKFCCQQHE